jgi:putative cell wall-binding protein
MLPIVVAVLLACALVLASPEAAMAAQDDDIPGVPLCQMFVDSVNVGTDANDVFRVYLLADERLSFTLTEHDDAGSDLDILVYRTDSTAIAGGTVISGSATGANPEIFTFICPAEGWYYIRVNAWGGGGGYTLETTRWWLTPNVPDPPERIWGADRYSTSVALAAANFPGWLNCDHVILASGEDRAAADPLAASGLAWAYGGPVLLTQSDRVPPSVMSTLRAISDANGGVTVHVVGGPVSVPNARLGEITAQVNNVTFDRITPFGDRFELAGAIARRMDAERPRGHHRSAGFGGPIALIANGADADKFFDALALSPLAARTGYPILLVEEDRIPAATWSALNALGIDARIVGGGPATVSEGVLAELAEGPGLSTRLAGSDRYSTAVRIASAGGDAWQPWTLPHNVGVTAKLPDALAGGAFTGLRGSPIVLTATDSLPASTASYLHGNTMLVSENYVIGGPASVTAATAQEIYDAYDIP